MRPGLLGFVLVLASCSPQAPSRPSDGESGPSTLAELARPTGIKVVLVGIDGASPVLLREFMERGELPEFARLVEQGSWGLLDSVAPMYSPALWTEILTGRPREEHGILEFTATTPEGELRLVQSGDRRCLALWNLLGPFGLTTGFVGFWATWPAEPVSGFMVSDRAARTRYVEWVGARRDRGLTFPPELAAEVAPLLVDPSRPDLEAIARLVELTPPEEAEMLAAERPILYHGPSVLKFGFSAQQSYERIALELFARKQPDLAGVFLMACDPICHTYWHHYQPEAFLRKPDDRSRRLGAIIPGIYRHNDRFLGALREVLDTETVVVLVSDHGFQSAPKLPEDRAARDYDELRQEALQQDQIAVGQSGMHHPVGVILLAGGPIRSGIEVRARLADVTPTILALLGLPVAEDMPGRVLEEVLDPGFLRRHPVQVIDSYERRIDRDRLRGEASYQDGRLLDELRALGYIR